ncbi:MAG: hypothetical protein ACJAZ4_002126 [Neptuniibacter pectenicola]|jgi:hypothetical protein
MQGRIIDIVVARLNEEHKGIMADRLWNLFTATIGK